MTVFILDVKTDPATTSAELRLSDERGRHLAANRVDLVKHPPSLWEGLFDTRAYVKRYRGLLRLDGPAAATAEQMIDHLGAFIGQTVLGSAAVERLADGIMQRTLLVRLPDPRGDSLAAAFARVPWEIARPARGQASLASRNLVVRAVPADVAAVEEEAGKPGDVRVLLVFAESPGSSPLAMRQERESLLKLFHAIVDKPRRLSVDVACHGVTRKLLREKVRSAGGYDVVHWSGHGHHDLLELTAENGEPPVISGKELVQVLASGGYVPRVVFLSACLSGAFIDVRDWRSLRDAIRGDVETKSAEAPALDDVLDEQPGYTGGALALLRAGVAQVVAMRYEVSDDYARCLAERFYAHLLADQTPKAVDVALALARGELETPEHRGRFAPVDHATPLVFGWGSVRLEAARGRGAQVTRRRPRPTELLPGGKEDLHARRDFVGRGTELTALRTTWLPEEGQPVALVQGLAGMGKTSVAAEAIHLWHGEFDWVLAYQSRPHAITVESFYQDVEDRLSQESEAHREACEEWPRARVFLPATKEFCGEKRYSRLRANLLEALTRERILLVLDNFESHLKPTAGPDGYACEDPEWDAVLQALARGLGRTGSRLLMTCRHRVAALDEARTLWLPLGPLPLAEAALFMKSHDRLASLVFGGEDDQKLAKRALEVTRGHPLIMERLANLAGDKAGLASALERLDNEGLRSLPDVFAGPLTPEQRAEERRRLEDVAVGAIDLLIERASEPARRLLWLASLAEEPSSEGMLAGVWSGLTMEQEMTRRIGEALANIEEQTEEVREWLATLSLQRYAECQAMHAAPRPQPVEPLLKELRDAGLLSMEASGYACHELVRERADAWMHLDKHRHERGPRSCEQVWQAYGERYAAAFNEWIASGREGAQETAGEMGRLALVYLVRAGDFAALRGFVSRMVAGTNDPTLLEAIIAQLLKVAEQVPEGKMRWKIRTYLADALRGARKLELSLPLYEQAAEAEQAGHWADVGAILNNWALAQQGLGQFELARQAFRRSIEAANKAGSPRADVLASELETLRLDVRTGEAEFVMPVIAQRLEEVRDWWRRHRQGQKVPEAPNVVFLARVILGTLDVATMANAALERWEDCLKLLEETEEVNRQLGASAHERAMTRFNRYGPLLRLERLPEAQAILESCLDTFRSMRDVTGQAQTLSALATVWNRRGDIRQAIDLARQALVFRDRLADPAERALSHGNLAIYLSDAAQFDEAARHYAAALAYDVVVGRRPDVERTLHNVRILMTQAAADGRRFDLPGLAELVARPEFDALRQFLERANLDVVALQAGFDVLLAQVRASAAEE